MLFSYKNFTKQISRRIFSLVVLSISLNGCQTNLNESNNKETCPVTEGAIIKARDEESLSYEMRGRINLFDFSVPQTNTDLLDIMSAKEYCKGNCRVRISNFNGCHSNTEWLNKYNGPPTICAADFSTCDLDPTITYVNSLEGSNTATFANKSLIIPICIIIADIMYPRADIMNCTYEAYNRTNVWILKSTLSSPNLPL